MITFVRLISAIRKPDLWGRAKDKFRRKLAMRRYRKMGVKIGKNTTINPCVTFMDRDMVTIGNDCSISGCVFGTHSGYDRIASLKLSKKIDTRKPITVGNNTFIGACTAIAAGVTIGNDCIISLGSVVFDDIPDDSFVRGNPAVVIWKTSEYLRKLNEKFAL